MEAGKGAEASAQAQYTWPAGFGPCTLAACDGCPFHKKGSKAKSGGTEAVPI
jgi:hypothetical protein